MLKVIWKIANACHIDRCQLSGVSDKEKKLNAAAFKGEQSRANLFAQPTALAVLFSTLVCSLGLVPTSPSCWAEKPWPRAAYSDQAAATVSPKDVLVKAHEDGHSQRTPKPGTPRLSASLTCDG